MSIRIDATKKLLAQAYTADVTGGTYFGLGTDNPEPGQPPVEAPSGGGRVYGRRRIQWSVDDEGVATGECHIPVDSGEYTYAILFSDADSDSVFDYCSIGTLPMLAAGEVVLSATFTQA
jgi:hypothetical protein